MPIWQALPDGNAERIVEECRKCLEEEAGSLPPRIHFRMLGIQRAMKETRDHTNGFTLEDVFEQIRKIAERVEDIPDSVVTAARKAKLDVNPASFFNSYVSGKKDDGKSRRFNHYVRDVSRRIGLGYIAVLGRHDQGGRTYFRLELARNDTGPDEPPNLKHSELEKLRGLIRDGSWLLATKGWGAEEVGQVYREAVGLAEKLVASGGATMAALRFEAGIGLWSHSLVIGKFEVAKTEAARLLDIAEQNHDRNMHIVALRAAGTNAFWLGRFVDAESYLRRCLQELDGFDYQPFATDLGASPFSLVCADLADTLWVLGRHKDAIETIRRARAELVGKAHPFHDCYSLAFSSWIDFKLGKQECALEQSQKLQDSASKHGLAAFRALGKMLEGIILASQSEDPSENIGWMYQGLGDWYASGSKLLVCYFLTEAARSWLRCGHPHAAELELNKAFELAERTGEGYYSAEMHRLQADIKWLSRKNFAEAEADLRNSLEIASVQQSLTFQLRAATSLLQMVRTRNDLSVDRKRQQVAEQEHVLRSVLNSIEQPCDSADWKAARSLLAEIPSPVPRRRTKSR